MRLFLYVFSQSRNIDPIAFVKEKNISVPPDADNNAWAEVTAQISPVLKLRALFQRALPFTLTTSSISWRLKRGNLPRAICLFIAEYAA